MAKYTTTDNDRYYVDLVNSSEAIQIIDGSANWDIIYIPSKDKCYAAAKVKGCITTHYGDLNYVRQLLVNGHSVGMITLQGEQLLNLSEYQVNKMNENKAKKTW